MNKLFSIVFFFGFSVCVCADIIDTLAKMVRIDLIDREKMEEAEERAQSDYGYATWLYFMGGDEFYYTGSLFLDGDELILGYFPPGQEGSFENGSSVMAYTVRRDSMELILKRWSWVSAGEGSGTRERDIEYYHAALSESEGKITYSCSYIDPALDLRDYTVNEAAVADENVYAYTSPSFKSQRLGKLEKGAGVKILPTKLAENGPEEEPYDFWYKIEAENKEVWVYGYSIQFSNKIILPKNE